MASQTFTFVYEVTGGMAPGPLDVVLFGSPPSGYAFVESASDGDGINSSTNPGQPIDETTAFLALPLTFLALTTTGDVVVSDGDGQRWVLSNDPALGLQVTPNPGVPILFCFAPGTLIATEHSEATVETLAIGDLVQIMEGRLVPVRWIGRQTVNARFGSTANIEPVCIQAGALGKGLPRRDLTVSADHGMILDEMVINASALVNGTTIDFVPVAELDAKFIYYHIETEAHDIILANGAPAETFVDIPGRMAFDNYQEYLDLYGTERIIPEMDRPRIASRRLLPDALKARLGIEDEVIALGDIADQRLTA